MQRDSNISVTRPGGPIRLRPATPSDAEAILPWLNDPEITKNFAGFGEPITLEVERAFLAKMAVSGEDRLFAIEAVEGGPVIGTVGLHRIYWPARNARLGVMIGGQETHGRGLGQEALRLVIAFGFRALGLHKVWLVHYSENGRMRHIAGKLGFAQEGVLRDEYFHAGRYHDMVRHALLAPEWEALGRDREVAFG